MADDPVIVVGAGIGGLVSAALLAARGFRVTVVERAAGIGGKLRQLPVGTAMIDAGPTVFTMRWVFDAILDSLGLTLDSSLPLTRASLLARHAWPDGSTLDLHDDRARSADAIGAFAGAGAARGYQRFAHEAQAIYETLETPFLRGGCTSALGLTARIGLAGLPRLAGIRPHETLWRALGRHFADPRLRQLFARYATYSGASPFAAPATLMLIAHVEAMGVWRIAGGLHTLADLFARLATSHGATIRTSAETRAILTRDGRATGVELASGEQLHAATILVNADPQALAVGAIAGASRAVRPHRDRSLSALVTLHQAETAGFSLSHHNVFFSSDYGREFADLAAGRLPFAPTAYICAQDRAASADARTSAPERLQIIINAPARGDTHTLSEQELAACDTALQALLTRCDLHLTPMASAITTPTHFNSLFPATGGALYGRATHGMLAAFKRPGARTAIPGLYLTGGGCHPGAGVPMAALSGQQAVACILADRASTARSSRAAMPGGMSMPSPRTARTA
ncbi:1-hydroxycarotenoid 3,4-desaturase CrtD [Sandaracinobacteroides saxicola]|uniref:FAD-dependent oxidoreductase n=1 Tax=Sandaracinobacteroides saxicola TaxID=2759707 RepID=A0A7G5IKS5_9SPHN|nr:1-hydroxycarotenoid 3,4-desaturase CrtD [Sandaracinobacteroides saxicola]QMW23967.1 FAD-dependent oxidoreductase [Sandaracinobacteroides saxicola]